MRRNVLLNPGPGTTTEAVKRAQLVTDICPREAVFGELLRALQRKLLAVVNGGVSHHCVLFGGSGTAAVEACISSVIPHQGRLLVIDNGAYGARLGDIARVHYGAGRVISLSSDPLRALDLGNVEALLKRTPGLTHLAVVHHETTTGLLNPIERLFELAQRYGVALIVDAMSSFAALPIDLEITPYPYLIASSNKCLQGMAGASFVIARSDALDASADHPPRSLYLDLHAQHRTLADEGQMRFTPPVQTLYALDRALDETLQEGVAQRLARYRRNGQLMRDALGGLGFELANPDMPQAGLLSCYLEPDWPGFSFVDMHDYAFARGFTIYPGKLLNRPSFRLATMGDLHEPDIQAFIAVLSAYVDGVRPAGRLAAGSPY